MAHSPPLPHQQQQQQQQDVLTQRIMRADASTETKLVLPKCGITRIPSLINRLKNSLRELDLSHNNIGDGKRSGGASGRAAAGRG